MLSVVLTRLQIKHILSYLILSYRQCSNDECLIIDFYGIYYCSFIIVDYVFANEMNWSATEYSDMILSNFPFSALFEFIFFQFFFLPIPNFSSYCFPATLIPNTPNPWWYESPVLNYYSSLVGPIRFMHCELIWCDTMLHITSQKYDWNTQQISNIRRTKSENLNESHLLLQLSLLNPLKPGVKSRKKM